MIQLFVPSILLTVQCSMSTVGSFEFLIYTYIHESTS